MAHEITNTDGLVLHKQGAWHGLGTIVEDAPTPTEALAIAGLDWGIAERPVFTLDDENNEIDIPSHKSLFRCDTQEFLGIVGTGYVPFTNQELADFAESLASEGDVVHCESAGSIRGGKKVWFLLKGESFSVREQDRIEPYILVSGGHDGATGIRCTPTTIRVVCSNTLHAVIPHKDSSGQIRHVTPNAFATSHTLNVKDRVNAARQAIGLYVDALAQTREAIGTLADMAIERERAHEYFLARYVKDFPPTSTNSKRWLAKRDERHAAFMARYDVERPIAGDTLWNVFNAYSWTIQNIKARGKDDGARQESRLSSNLFGVNSERTVNAFDAAMQLAV